MFLALTLISTIAGASLDSIPALPGPRAASMPVGITRAEPDDTVPRRPRRRAIELSDAYSTRLKIHKIASLTIVPLFAAQSIVGAQLYSHGGAGTWMAKEVHRPLAYAIGGLFLTNTVTGSLNWWETRHQEKGRAWRTAHALLMLASDGGFAYTSWMGSRRPLNQANRDLHKNWAIASGSVALASYLMMLKPIRRD
jgi:hypothetical protein